MRTLLIVLCMGWLLPGCGMAVFEYHPRRYARADSPAWGCLKKGAVIETTRDIFVTDYSGHILGGAERVYIPSSVPQRSDNSRISSGECFTVVSLSEKGGYSITWNSLALTDKRGRRLVVERTGGLYRDDLYSEQRLHDIGFRLIK